MGEKRIEGKWVGLGKVYHRNTQAPDGKVAPGALVGTETFTMPAEAAYQAWAGNAFVPSDKKVGKAFEARRDEEGRAAKARGAGLDKVALARRFLDEAKKDPALLDEFRALLAEQGSKK